MWSVYYRYLNKPDVTLYSSTWTAHGNCYWTIYGDYRKRSSSLDVALSSSLVSTRNLSCCVYLLSDRGTTASPALVALDPSLTSVMRVYKLFMNCPAFLCVLLHVIAMPGIRRLFYTCIWLGLRSVWLGLWSVWMGLYARFCLQSWYRALYCWILHGVYTTVWAYDLI